MAVLGHDVTARPRRPLRGFRTTTLSGVVCAGVSWLLANPTLSLSAKLGVLGSVALVIAVWIHRQTAGFVLLGLLPFAGVSISEGVGFLRWVTVIVIVAWFLSVLLLEPAGALRMERMDLWVAAFIGVSVASAFVLNPEGAPRLAATAAANLGSYFVISRSARSVRDASVAALPLCLGLGVAAGIALAVPGAAAVREGGGIIRLGAVGAAGDPTAGVDRFGGELIFAVVLPWVAFRRASLATLLARAASVMALIALVSTVSRAATVGLVVVLVAWALVFPSSTRMARVAAAIALLVLGLAFLPSELRARFEGLRAGQREALSRLAIWRGGLRMFWAHPATGVGAGNFAARLPRYLRTRELSETQQDAHSVFVAALAETGLVGFLAMLAMMVRALYETTAWAGRRGPRGPPGDDAAYDHDDDEESAAARWRRLSAGLLVTFVGFVVVAATLDLTRDRFLFAVVALIHAVYRVRGDVVAPGAELEDTVHA